MNEMIIFALLATLCTWFITALGSATVIFFKAPTPQLHRLAMGFAAGVMIAASFWSLLAPALERAEEVSSLPPYLVATVGFIAGALFIWLSDKTLSRVMGNKHNVKRVIMLVLSITLHNIPEGLAIGVAFGALAKGSYTAQEIMAAFGVALGIGIQNFPEGAAVSLPLRKEGYSRAKSFLIGQATALVEPVAGVLGALLVMHVEMILPYALSFAAGAMILVATHELIPECQQDREHNPFSGTMAIITGFAVMMLLDVMLG